MRRRPLIPQRRLIFIGCEGESEAGYARGLEDLANQAGSHMALQVAVLDKGHALARIESAKRKVLKLRQSRQLRFEARFLMLDTDEFETRPAGLARANRVAKQNGFQVIWQEPCFEALLLRHFRDSRPPPVALHSILYSVNGRTTKRG